MCATLSGIFCHCVLLEIGTEILFHRILPIYTGVEIERSVIMTVFVVLALSFFVYIYKDLLKSKNMLYCGERHGIMENGLKSGV